METQNGKNTKYISGVSQYVINCDDDFVLINTTQPVALYLPNIQGSGLLFKPKRFYIVDNTGNAAANNITIYPSGANQINGESSYVMSTNFENVEVMISSQTEYLILSDTSTNGGGGTVTEYTEVLTAGNNTIDLSGRTGELIINLTSGSSTPIIVDFTNYTNVTKITLRPANTAGLVVTVQDRFFSGNNSIALNAPTLDIYGPQSGFLELTKRTVVGSTLFWQTNYIDQYAT
jgi:hypothetical protein